MVTPQSRLTRAEWGLGLWWVVATAAGWLVGFAVCEAFSAFLKSLSSDGLVIGTGVGIAQWLVLRGRFNSAGWWIPASIIGFGIGKLDGNAVVAAVAGPLGVAMGGAAIGVTLGLAQWVVLRRHVAAAGWWVLASAFGWALGWILISLADEAVSGATATAYLSGAVGAAVAGAITGLFLIRLMRSGSLDPA